MQLEGFQCHSYVVDISDKEQVYETAKKVKQEVGNVGVLLNNAGIVTCRTLLDLPDKAIESTYGVNILSHYWVSFIEIKIQTVSKSNFHPILDRKSFPP